MFIATFLLFTLFANTANSFFLHGATPPLGLFDPLKFMEKADTNTLAKYREAELKHGRWAMMSTASIPLIEQQTHTPAIHAFDNLPDNMQLLIVGFILMGEFNTMLRGYTNPFSLTSTDNYFKMKNDYQPGDMGYEISSVDNVNIYDAELNNGRLAMIGFLGMVVQELVTNNVLFPSVGF